MNGELWFCQECEDHNRDAVVRLDRRLRCAQCGSDAVESVERLLALQRLLAQRPRHLVLAVVMPGLGPAYRGVQAHAKPS